MSVRIVSDNEKVTEIIQYYVLRVNSEGGYINPNLVFNCNQAKPTRKGMLSLSGVKDHSLALHVPPSINIEIGNGRNLSEYKNSMWYQVYKELEYKKIDEMDFLLSRCFETVISPLADMVNNRRSAGKWAGTTNGVWLYGSEVKY